MPGNIFKGVYKEIYSLKIIKKYSIIYKTTIFYLKENYMIVDIINKLLEEREMTIEQLEKKLE